MTIPSQTARLDWAEAQPQRTPTLARHPNRWKVFVTVLLLAVVIGVSFVYGRDAVYRATASVLTVKPKAVDTLSAPADLEHVAIEQRLLLGEELLSRLADRLAEDAEPTIAEPDALRQMLSVVPVPDTNLIELRAEGDAPELLQRMVNLWAQLYEGFRAEQVSAVTGRTTAELEDKQARLARKIEDARAELKRFREQHDIVSLEREENRSLASLRGLNESLNQARERLIEAQARLESIDRAIMSGETVVPSEQKADLARMEVRVQGLRDRLGQLTARYTPQYIAQHPDFRDLPEQLEIMERELERAVKLAQITVRDEAQQELVAADDTVRALEAELAGEQRRVQTFTQRFQEFQSLEEELARLDELYADNRERLAQIQVRNLEEFPPMQVVEWAHVPTRPIRPDYARDLLVALLAALLVALFATWLSDYLSERADRQSVYFVGVRGGAQGHQASLDVGYSERPPLEHHGHPSAQLTAPSPDDTQVAPHHPDLPRELAAAEIRALLEQADEMTAGYCVLLLAGISPGELELMRGDCFDETAETVSVPGQAPRQLALAPPVWHRLEPFLTQLETDGVRLSATELDARIQAAASAAHLSAPKSVNALSIWHSYVLYLVGQGIGFGQLQDRVGPIPGAIRPALAAYSPSGLQAEPSPPADWVHPALLL